MDISKRKVRFSLERLEKRDVPARLGQVVELPYAAAPVAEVALTAPADLGQGGEASIRINSAGSADLKFDPVSAVEVQFQDIAYTSRVGKHTPVLF